MLVHRLATGTCLVVLLLASLVVDELWLAPWFPIWTLLSLLFSLGASREIVSLLQRTSAAPSRNTVMGGVAAVVLANPVPHLTSHWLTSQAQDTTYAPLNPVHALAWPFLAFVGVVMVSFVAQGIQFTRPGRTMATLSGSIFAVAYVGLLGSFMIQMRWFDGSTHGIVPLLMLLATAKGADVGAYFMGRMAGRHKLWPRLSPNKTLEGAVGGLICGVFGAVVITVAAGLLGQVALDVPRAVGYGLLVGSAAQLGDLMESMIKRDCEQKDASDTLPGFGGVLDVLDSLLFAGPIGFGYWLFLGP